MENKNKLELLVVKNSLKHLAVKKALEDGVEIGLLAVDYCTTFEEAKNKIKEKEYDGTISDAYLPLNDELEDTTEDDRIPRISTINFISTAGEFHHINFQDVHYKGKSYGGKLK